MARPLAFDPQEKLHQAMLLFWRKGYEATSVQDLVDALQINRFSLYNTFGDKEALFAQVIKHYRRTVFGRLESQLQPASDGLPRLFGYLEALKEGLRRQPGPWGCLLQNATMEQGDFKPAIQSLIDEFVTVLHGHVLAILVAAKAQGQLRGEQSAEVLADFVTTQIQGMILMSRTGNGDALNSSIAVLQGVLQS